MQLSMNMALPVWQSRILLVAGLAALAAAELGAGIYAFQSAARSQELYGVPVDATLKTVISIAAGLGVALGASVSAWLWRTGRKGLRKQAQLAILMTIWALTISIGNLSGYFAWTRAQHGAEAVRATTAYQVAVERINGREYVSDEDRALARRGQAPSDAERELGDIGKAFSVHLLILGFAAAYRLPAPPKKKRATRPQRARGTPKLRAVQ